MEKNNIVLVASSLAPSAILLTTALILTIRFHYRPLQRVEVPNATPTVIINQQINSAPTNNDIPLQPRMTIHAPILWWATPVNSILTVGGEMEDGVQPDNEHVQERRSPTPPRRCTPIIILSTTSSSSSIPYIIQSPSLLSKDNLTEQRIRYKLGASHPNCPITPHYGYITPRHAGVYAVPAPTPFDPGNLWDNLLIPYSTYFPAGNGSPNHRTPPPKSTNYPSIVHWDQLVVQDRKPTPEQEPVAELSHWSTWQEIDEWLQPLADQFNWRQLMATRQGRWPIESDNSDTATELLPKVEYINGIHGESPTSSVPEIQPEATPDTPDNDTT